MPKYLDYGQRKDGIVLLPILEFAVGSLQLSKEQALIELGFPEDEVRNLMTQRMAEDLETDPRVQGSLVRQLENNIAERNNGSPKAV